jgi:hypothetical protein
VLFGDYSYGHVSREVPTHIYLMHWDLSALEDGKWKSRDEFKPCFSALKHVSLLGNGINATGKEYHGKPQISTSNVSTTYPIFACLTDGGRIS